ncbi:MAG: carbon starvation CstA family protein [Desulfobacca sp.]|nr:carbon starvation CstA family protein [Desulfobacca sp.]
MNSLVVLLFWAIIVGLGYFVYSKWVNQNIFEADPNRATPAKMYLDGVDYMPANKTVLFGFQLNSIAGAAPIIGPIIALQWGWLPAVLWLGFGVLLIGWVQDYSICMVSVKNDGDTLGALSYKLISPRSRAILLAFIYFYLLLLATAFGDVISKGLSGNAALPLPMLVAVGTAFLVGHLIYRSRVNILLTTLVAIVLIFGGIALGNYLPIRASYNVMLVALCIFAYFGATLPVWQFIQPYNYASVYVTYFGIITGIIGVLISAKPMTLPAVGSFNIGLGPLWPMMFVTIACGAISGWHSLVSSIGTSRQIENELDVRPVTSGAMFAEFTISVIAVIVCATAFTSNADYLAQLKAAGPVAIFTTGLGGAITSLGFPATFAQSVGGAMILILALTTINLVFRFMKVATVELLGGKVPLARNQHVAVLIAVIITFFLIKTGYWLYIWVLFGGANQLMASLALLLVTLYLASTAKNYRFILYPMFFMYISTVAAIFYTAFFKLLPPVFSGQLTGVKTVGHVLSATFGVLLIVLALILAYDGYQAFKKYRAANAALRLAEAGKTH